MRAKILYVMHIDWHWIKQRPHSIAEGLAETSDVLIVYRRAFKRSCLSNNTSLKVKLFPCILLPELGSRIVQRLNESLMQLCIFALCVVWKPKYIVYSSPIYFSRLHRWFGAQIIYDCMDDMVAFTKNQMQQRIITTEKLLVSSASAVVSSSENLRMKLINRYTTNRVVVIRNGYYPLWDRKIWDNELLSNKGEIVFGYFGTISSWFDFKVVKQILSASLNYSFRIAGPLEVSLPILDRLEYVGIIQHDKLDRFVNDIDVLCLPFIVNELILSVDPVKLYEYIYFNKRILCVKYPEIHRYEPFVEFYSDENDLAISIENITNKPIKYDSMSSSIFLSDNSWQNRIEQFNRLLK
jgi:teichuronic acid biosynthesis glycosyltransferase TuaH